MASGRGAAWRRSTPLAIAHRGQRATLPEQTLEAYREAIELGCEGIECDVQRTADGELVMLHDLTLDRTTSGHGPVSAIRFEELRRLDAGSWFGAEFGDLRVPTLDETLELAIAAGVPLCIEIKGTAGDAPGTARAVASRLLERGLLDRAFVSSFDHAALAAAREAAPGILLAPERLPEDGPPDAAAAVAQASALGAAVLQHRWEQLTTEVVDALHDAGASVWAWPIDSLEAVDHSVAVGVDGIIGDDVTLLLAGLGRTPAHA
ncbi:MAG TPA: glycerophosphodiester phosphodiesterase family protein [Candidatus Limnocylindrales bacterium]|nr:glycerophosphodiester phosphodiesterase family protein [Candidatus Limnocylindrales bacterium]